jgi:hypothetical protein
VGPTLQISAEGTLLRDGRTYGGGDLRLSLRGEDPSGLGKELHLLLDWQPVTSPTDIDWPPVDREVKVVGRGDDALGNRAESDPLVLTLDRTPPTLAARRASPQAGIPADIVAPGEPITLLLEDTGVGLASLELDARTHALDASGAQTMTMPMPATTAYVLRDQLGNAASRSLTLRVDDAPPRLMLVSDGVAQAAGDSTTLPRSERLDVVAEDPLSGVARACVELSIWYDECRPLPLSLVGIDPGRYRVVFRASDRLGNKASERFEIEVLP